MKGIWNSVKIKADDTKAKVTAASDGSAALLALSLSLTARPHFLEDFGIRCGFLVAIVDTQTGYNKTYSLFREYPLSFSACSFHCSRRHVFQEGSYYYYYFSPRPRSPLVSRMYGGGGGGCQPFSPLFCSFCGGFGPIS